LVNSVRSFRSLPAATETDQGDGRQVASTEDRYRVQAVDRALDLLEFLAEAAPGGTGLTEVAKLLHVSKSSAFGLLRTLVRRGYVRETRPGPRYHLGLSLLRLGDAASNQLPIGEFCRAAVTELSRRTGLTARCALAEEGQPVFIERVDGPGGVRFHTPLGRCEPPHATAAGKAILSCLTTQEVREVVSATGMPARSRHTITDLDDLLADLERARQRGYAIDDEEDADGVVCVAAPFFDHSGTCLGALSVTGLKAAIPTRRLHELGLLVREQADQLSKQLGAPTVNEDGRERTIES